MKKLLITGLAISFIAGCKTENKETSPKENNITAEFYVGTYTDKESKGIYSYSLSEDGSLVKNKLVAASENPSFLSYSSGKKYVLAVNENEKGTVESYKREKDSLLFISRSTSGGAHPCFVTATNDGYVLTANYTGGNTGLLQLGAHGELSELLDIHQHSGKGKDARQDSAHAHSVWILPDQKGLIEVDLGTNQLWFSSIENGSISPGDPATLDMNAGDGPRHITLHPAGKRAYVLNELSSTIVTIMLNDQGIWEKGTAVSTLPDDYSGESYGADIRISSDGKFIYASNRGHNSIAIFKVGPAGNLTVVGYEPVRGNWPRNFSLSPKEDFLVVANQHSNNIVSFQRDKTTGLLTYTASVNAPSPVCILF
ncbi:lactonase family protein [Zhouia spongiae]|uniref:Lactonase family protein n=1 Tax=Zhouia spongiae TaxID=2202721 RepID=A0ABY3YQ57_9FLAO|nr:lactonase family protein [Zhouia spongiae]UNY99745.1 lactonase family protein [Zhouia spongiae]